MATTSVRPTIQDGHEAREMNDAEFAQYDLDVTANKAQQQAQAAKATQKQAVLDKLGLTADEVKVLLG
jgi:hypothetical protein